jgi:hypothetical protein
LKRFIEAPDAAEAGSEGDLCDRQQCFVQELLSEMDTSRLLDGQRARSNMLHEQSAELAACHSKSGRERLHIEFDQRTLVDQSQRPVD